MDLINSEFKTKLIELFDISLDDYWYPETTKYELLSPDCNVNMFVSLSSRRYFVFYIEDFINSYKDVVSAVEQWHDGKVIHVYKPVKQKKKVFTDKDLQTYASDGARGADDTVLLFEVTASKISPYF